MTKKILISCAIFLTGIMVFAQAPAVTSIEYYCDSAILVRNAPNAGGTYYWQGTSCGTAMTNSSLNYTATTTGIYFLRAYTSSMVGTALVGIWAGVPCASTNVVIREYPTAPPVPTYASGQLTLASPPADVTFYWQGNSCDIDDGDSNPSLPVTVSGTYYARAFHNVYKCWSLDCSSKLVEITGINNTSNPISNILLTPTPAFDKVFLNLPENIKSVNVVLYDMSGKVVLTKKAVTSNEMIDLSGLNNGSYVARFKNDNVEQNQLILINK